MDRKTTRIGFRCDRTIESRDGWSRRDFLKIAALAGTGALVASPDDFSLAEPLPETTRLRVARTASICQAPQYIAGALFEAEGFTDVKYVGDPAAADGTLASGDADMGMLFAGPLLIRIDEGAPIVILGGGHTGCLELFAHEPVRSVKDLKGRSAAVQFSSAPHVFLAMVMAYVGLDPRKDVTIVGRSPVDAMRMFEEKKVDAYIGSPPWSQELRARNIGRLVITSTVDRPWSQYFCCVIVGHREFVRSRPAATKRAMRAILKANQICSLEPERAARTLVDKDFTKRYDYALQTIKELPYGKWREYDPEDTVRFYSLRLHEVGMIKSAPQKIISQGTDWRFLKELKKELKT
jgi:NitT/TauT family transport system substrate-binding protein